MTWTILESKVMNGANHLAREDSTTSLCGQSSLKPLGARDDVPKDNWRWCSKCVRIAREIEEGVEVLL